MDSVRLALPARAMPRPTRWVAAMFFTALAGAVWASWLSTWATLN